MVTVTLGTYHKTKVLYLQAHFNYKERLKKLQGASFDWNKKMWYVPATSLVNLQESFKGELYFKTPLWKVLGNHFPGKMEKRIYDEEIRLPQTKLSPYIYQKEGILFMIDRIKKYGFTLNSDQMGLGKTFQALGTLAYFLSHPENGPCDKILIICKKSIKTQWAAEIQKFIDLPEEYQIYITKDGTKKKRVKTYSEIESAGHGVLITNYHNFLNDQEEIGKINFDFVIIDEAHQLKAHDGIMNHNVAQICQGKKTVLLTGTPVMSRPNDIYGLTQLAKKDFFGTYEDFEKKYLVVDNGIYGRQIVGAKNLDSLSEQVQDFMIRRDIEDLGAQDGKPDFPTVIIETIPCECDKTQKALQEAIEFEMGDMAGAKEKLMQNGKVIPGREEQFQAFLDREKGYLPAKQFAADDPRLIAAREGRMFKRFAKKIEKGYRMSSKSEALIDLVGEILEAEEKVIIFTHYYTPIPIIKEDLEKKYKITPLVYSGKEKDEERDRNVELFLNSDEHNVLIANDAAAEGLNLQKCHYLINYEQADTDAIKQQRIGRIRRVGSDSEFVRIYDLITEDSLDVKKLQKIERDKNTVAAVLNL